jgi:peptidoglycan biosynthesis protein MviN/MurJ (putative lipid II flippase)
MERVCDLLSRISGLVTEFLIGNILGIQEIADA